MPQHITLFEMAPRDGLQNEARHVPTADKIHLVDLLSQTGLGKIEVSSFVSPKWVPQLADAQEVFAGIARRQGIAYTALTPNMRGWEGAQAAKADEVAVFASASEGFSQANINASVAESLTRFAPVFAAAKAAQTPVRAYISCVTDCPYDGPTAPGAVADLVAKLLGMGAYEVSLGDTIGAATPETTAAMLRACLEVAPAHQLAGHFHDTKGRALENAATALEMGLTTLDGAVGGLGGCPFAPGAAGNVATEALADLIEAQGHAHGLDRAALARAVQFAQSLRSPL